MWAVPDHNGKNKLVLVILVSVHQDVWVILRGQVSLTFLHLKEKKKNKEGLLKYSTQR